MHEIVQTAFLEELGRVQTLSRLADILFRIGAGGPNDVDFMVRVLATARSTRARIGCRESMRSEKIRREVALSRQAAARADSTGLFACERVGPPVN